MRPTIYILTNGANRVLYVGVTANLPQRLYAHRMKIDALSFTGRYSVTKLVYYESHPTMEAAILREKQLKGGSRARKVRLIEGANPRWVDLTGTLGPG